jgi:hypothetical protein
MAEDADNHTIRLLQEMRKEMRDSFENVNIRIDGLTHILTLLAGNMAHHEERIDKLESK